MRLCFGESFGGKRGLSRKPRWQLDFVFNSWMCWMGGWMSADQHPEQQRGEREGAIRGCSPPVKLSVEGWHKPEPPEPPEPPERGLPTHPDIPAEAVARPAAPPRHANEKTAWARSTASKEVEVTSGGELKISSQKKKNQLERKFPVWLQVLLLIFRSCAGSRLLQVVGYCVKKKTHLKMLSNNNTGLSPPVNFARVEENFILYIPWAKSARKHRVLRALITLSLAVLFLETDVQLMRLCSVCFTCQRVCMCVLEQWVSEISFQHTDLCVQLYMHTCMWYICLLNM